MVKYSYKKGEVTFCLLYRTHIFGTLVNTQNIVHVNNCLISYSNPFHRVTHYDYL